MFILEVVFCEGVQHRLRFCLDHLNYVKLEAYRFYFQSSKQECRVGGEWKSCCFWSEIPCWKRKGETVNCCDETVSYFVTKVRGEVLAHFHAVAVKRHSSRWNLLFSLPGRILCEQSLWCQRKWWGCSWLCSSPVSPFSVCLEPSMSFKHSCTAHAVIPKCLSNHCQGLCRILSEICTKSDAVPLSDQ
jgi:hypothetical protein